jgi:hypothetical protein
MQNKPAHPREIGPDGSPVAGCTVFFHPLLPSIRYFLLKLLAVSVGRNENAGEACTEEREFPSSLLFAHIIKVV